MTWFKLDDRFFDNPKIAALSDRAKVSYLEGGTFCARELTDGFIPLQKARGITGSSKALKELTPHLWEPVSGGYRVHDYLRYNPTRAQVLAERTEKHEAKVRAGKAGAAARWGDSNDGNAIAENMAGAMKTMAENSSTDSRKHSPVKPVSPSLSRSPKPGPPGDPSPPPGFMLKEPDDIDKICQRFAAFGLVNGGTASAIEEAVADYGVEWVKHAVRSASGSSFTEKPPWSYVEQILIRYKAQGHVDEPKPGRATNGANAGQSRRAAGANGERPSEVARRLGIGTRR